MTRSLLCLLAATAVPAAEPADGFPLPAGAVYRFGSRLARHPDGISSTTVSPDGKWLATTGSRTVIVWDVKAMTAKCVLRDQSPQSLYFDATGGVAFLPDSRHLLVSVSPNDQLFVPTRQNRPDVARVFDVETGKLKFAIKGDLDYAGSSWVASGGKEIAVFTNQKVSYFDAKDGKALRTVQCGNLFRGVLAVAPAANLVAFRYRNGNNAFALFDAAAGKQVGDFGGNRVSRVALSPDGKRMAYTTGDRQIHIHDLDVKKELLAFKLPGSSATAMQFSADLQILYFAGQSGRLYRWDLKNNKKLPDVGQHSSSDLSGIVLGPDESILFSTGHDHLIRRWDLKANKQFPLPPGYVTQTAIAPLVDRKTLVVSDHWGVIDLWDLTTGKRLKRLQDQNAAGIDTLTVSADGRWLACGRTTQDVALWDLRAGKPGRVIPLADKDNALELDHVKRVAFSADGTVLFTGSAETGISAWATATGKRLWNAPNLGPWLDADPRGRWIVTSSPEEQEQPQWVLLDAKTGVIVRRVGVPQVEEEDGRGIEYTPVVSDLAFTPDGSRLVTAHEDGRARIWNPETAVEVGRLNGTGRDRSSLAISADGRWVAVGQSDYKITVWEIASGKLLTTFIGHDSEVQDVAFTRDGRGVIGNADLAPLLWTLEPRDKATVGADMWDALATVDGAKAYKLQWALIKDPAAAVKLLSERIKPAEMALERATFAKWVKDLDSPAFRTREVAERELTRAGMRIPLGWLRQALTDANAEEPRARLERILAERDRPNPLEWRLLRAVQVLELAGTPEAVALLKSWAAVDGSAVTEAARGAVGRLAAR
jgi:WD40 repeat protein